MSDTTVGRPTLSWDAIKPARALPEYTDDQLTYQRVIMNPGATWDYFAGHHNPEYARAQGHPSIFINTMHIAGFIDHVAAVWAGPLSRVVRRSLTLAIPLYPGDTMTGRSQIVAKRYADGDGGTPGSWLVDMLIDVVNQNDAVCAHAQVTLDVSHALRDSNQPPR